jgi:lysophospholipase L1-like esterase
MVSRRHFLGAAGKAAGFAALLGNSLFSTGCADTGNCGIVVFRDQNNDGVIDKYGYEPDRIPNVRVIIGDAEGVTDSTGRAMLFLSPGKHEASVDSKTLPPYFEASPRTIVVPDGNMPAEDMLFPVKLDVSGNAFDVYMGFGDSITSGNGDKTKSYLVPLQQKLKEYFGIAVMINRGEDGTRTNDGSARIVKALENNIPSYALILYGTNDWNEKSCKTTFIGNETLDGCYTIANLEYMIDAVKANGSLPVLGTIPPINVGYDERMHNDVNRTQPVRQAWVETTNEEIRQLAVEKGVALADVYKAFADDPGYKADPASCFADHVHPNEHGTELIADAFFRGITKRPEWSLYTD